MITIQLNRKTYLIENKSTLQDILHENKFIEPCFATAINKKFILRAHYATTYLNEGDCIETIMPMQGG